MKKQLQTAFQAVRSRQGAVVVLWVVFMAVSLGSLLYLGYRTRKHEQSYVRLWAYTVSRLENIEYGDVTRMMAEGEWAGSGGIPYLIMSESGEICGSHLVSRRVIENPKRLERLLSRSATANEYITISLRDGSHYMIFYGKSRTVVFLTYFPLVQLLAFALLLWFWIATFRSNKVNEQNRVWVGLAKETAHQLGTPTSSLLGWIEFLKSQPVDREAVAEMEKDLAHLMKIADRFSKIGSETILQPTNVNELVGEAVMYFKKRIPRNVDLEYNGLAIAPVKALLNPALFEWVVENLLKNALDALQGRGNIDVKLSRDEKNIYIDVSDTGRGVPRANREKIFEPGFSTKTRGWGLGLSLSRRVVEEYHKGKIFVAESDLARGTTMRIVIKVLS